MLAYTNYEDYESMYKVESFDAANKFLPAIVLIISVLLFRCKLNGKQSKQVIANEKIIVVHVVLFLSYVITYASYLILDSYSTSSSKETIYYCRVYLSSWYFDFLYITANFATLILYIYMSVMFSRSLNNYWNEFLLSYRKRSLRQAI